MIKTTSFFLLWVPITLSAQSVQFGWQVFQNDSVYVEEFYHFGKVKSMARYPNGQLKYMRHLKASQIQDTICYYSANSSLLSKVYYPSLFYEIYDSALVENYSFVDSALKIVRSQIEHSFGETRILEYVFLDGSNSYQQSRIFNKFEARISTLYEPVVYDIRTCSILYTSKIDQYNKYGRNVLQFRIDSTLQIVQSNIDLKKQYDIRFDIAYVDSILTQLKFVEAINMDWKRAIRITGPYLEVRRKALYWITERQAGNLMTNDIDYMIEDNFKEELIINVETGEIGRNLKYVGPIDCY